MRWVPSRGPSGGRTRGARRHTSTGVCTPSGASAETQSGAPARDPVTVATGVRSRRLRVSLLVSECCRLH